MTIDHIYHVARYTRSRTPPICTQRTAEIVLLDPGRSLKNRNYSVGLAIGPRHPYGDRGYLSESRAAPLHVEFREPPTSLPICV